MNRKIFILFLSLAFSTLSSMAQGNDAKNDMQKRAESELENSKYITARYFFIRAYEDYFSKGRLQQGVECISKATALYTRENLYKEAFDLLHRVDQNISAASQPDSKKAALYYQVSKERLQIYEKLGKGSSAKDQLTLMEQQARTAVGEDLQSDLLYTKAIYYYTFGQNAKGNAVFKEMASKLTAKKEYDKVDEVYKALIANGRRSNSASMVAQAYSSYIAWKDSVSALKTADERNALKKQIADNEAEIADKDSTLAVRQAIIVGLCILAAALAAALAVGAIVLLRFIVANRRQKNIIKLANDNNALKSKFISNISAQLAPTLNKLDSRQPEVKAMLDFADHIQTLSELENTIAEPVETEDTAIQPLCEALMDEIRGEVRQEVTLTVNAPKMQAPIHAPYVRHILLHLLHNAAEYTPEGGHIWLEYKKRGAHAHQFLVSDTGCGIAEEQRENVFKPFIEIHDLTHGDGLGLPICKQMALKMNGDLEIDPAFTKGTRFVLSLHA